mmetsp:Transcript_3523/g.2106  ORF Transcript_3523/g.2106 Transcript_3523/m.2106 type:complete len:217 (+) Transcript_3523:227-877(+)
MLKKIKKKIIAHPLAHSLLYKLVIMYSRTFKLLIENEKQWISHIKNGDKVLLCWWHQQFFGFVYYGRTLQKYNPSIIISDSDDGEALSGVIKRTGWAPVRGSSAKGGKKAFRNILRKLKKSNLAGHTVDGPTGPIGIVKPGVVGIAQLTGAAIVPVYLITDKFWLVNSWDRFLIPKPFSKVKIKFGEIILCKRISDKNYLELRRKMIEQTMLPYLL